MIIRARLAAPEVKYKKQKTQKTKFIDQKHSVSLSKSTP